MSENRFMAIVALAEARFPSADDILSAFNERLPGANAKLIESEKPAAEDDSVMIEAGGHAFVCMFLPNPVPAGTFDHAAQASHFWQTAATDLAAHKAHIVVAEFHARQEPAGRRQCAAEVTHLAAAVCMRSLAPVIGVYWSNGETVTQPEQFIAEAERLNHDAWPILTWLQYYWVAPSTPRGNPGLVTHGLLPFVGREIEFEPCAFDQQTLFTRVGEISHYLVDQGPILGDNETLGVSETERIRIRHKDQGQREGVPVLELTLEQADPGSS